MATVEDSKVRARVFSPDPNRSTRVAIDEAVSKKLTAVGISVTATVFSVVFAAVAGAFIAALWDINGQINRVVGQEAIRAEIDLITRQRSLLSNKEIELLKKENSSLSSRLYDSQLRLKKLEIELANLSSVKD